MYPLEFTALSSLIKSVNYVTKYNVSHITFGSSKNILAGRDSPQTLSFVLPPYSPSA